MDELELIYEVSDRHTQNLVYAGEYRLLGAAKDLYRPLKNLFNDWRQRVYRFENGLGASVILYQPLTHNAMTWDLVTAQFVGDDPFDFRYADGINSNLRWREVQQMLDKIKTGQNQVSS